MHRDVSKVMCIFTDAFHFGQDPPKFSVVPGGVYRQEAGRELVIPCEAEGDPFPNITWRKVKLLILHPPCMCTMCALHLQCEAGLPVVLCHIPRFPPWILHF